MTVTVQSSALLPESLGSSIGVMLGPAPPTTPCGKCLRFPREVPWPLQRSPELFLQQPSGDPGVWHWTRPIS